MKLRGKTAIVTGAGRGLGQAASFALARAGARVALLDSDLRHLEETAGELEAAGFECMVVAGDVSAAEDVSRLVKETRDRFGGVDILLNNAGIIGPPRFLEDADADSWFAAININLNGMYLTSRAVIPIMLEQGGGRIINVTSGLGRMAFPKFCAYCVSKAGVDQLTRCLAEEYENTGIRLNAIDPGVMDTSMQEQIRHLGEEKLGRELHRRFAAFKSEGELTDPGRVAELVVYLASDDSGDISGEILSMRDLPPDFDASG